MILLSKSLASEGLAESFGLKPKKSEVNGCLFLIATFPIEFELSDHRFVIPNGESQINREFLRNWITGMPRLKRISIIKQGTSPSNEQVTTGWNL
jgi:hypothetical protein